MSVTISGSKQLFIQVAQTVVSAASTQSLTYVNASTWQDLSGYSVAITPSSSSNKVLIELRLGCCSSTTNYIGFRLLRNGTPIALADAAGTRPQATCRMMRESDGNHTKTGVSTLFLDSPATTSAVTYQWQWQCEGSGTIYLNRTQSDTDAQSYGARAISTITATEVSYA